MKVYSLYYKDTFVVAFPSREDAVDYGKKYYDEYAWDCNIVEEYLSKSPLLYSAPYTPPYNTAIPCVSPVISKPPASYPDSYPHIYCDGTK